MTPSREELEQILNKHLSRDPFSSTAFGNDLMAWATGKKEWCDEIMWATEIEKMNGRWTLVNQTSECYVPVRMEVLSVVR